MQLKIFLTTLTLMTFFIVLGKAADIEPRQPKLGSHCNFWAGIMLLSFFFQLIWVIWSHL